MALQPLLPADPATVGPHRLLGRLGQGGMGTVYLAVAPDDRAVAVKVLRDGPPDAEGRRRFARELDVLQRVRGPHLVEVLGGDALAPTPWIVTRFVPGQRLDEVVASAGPLDEGALVRVALGVAQALLALHTAGVVHRDLTPGNVLLVDGEPHVIDLGLAVVADVTMLTRSGLVLGTAGYLAPEQVVGLGVGPAADVHAWGATLALAGTGRPPYGTGRPEAVLYRVVHTEPDLDGLPAALAELVAGALAKEPAARPALADVVGALRSLAARDLVGVSSGPLAVLRGGSPDASGWGAPTGSVVLDLPSPVGAADRQGTEVLGRADRQVTEVLGPHDRQVTEVLGRPDRLGTEVLGRPDRQATEVLGRPDRLVTEVLGRGVLPADRQDTQVLGRADAQETVALRKPGGPDDRQDTRVLDRGPAAAQTVTPAPPAAPAPLGRDLTAAVRTDVRDRHDAAPRPVYAVPPSAPPAAGPTTYPVHEPADRSRRPVSAGPGAGPPGGPGTYPVPEPSVVAPARPDATRRSRPAVTVPALALLGVSALLAPVLALAAVLLGVVGLQAFASAQERRGRLVEQRGPRRRDPVVALLSSPVRLLDAVIDLVLTVPLLVAGALLPAYVVLAVTPQRGPTLGAAVGTVLTACLLLTRRRFRGARAVLRRGAALAAPDGPDAALLGAALLAATLALALAALTGAHWWPATAPPSGCLPMLTC